MNYEKASTLNAGDKVNVFWPATKQTSVVEFRGRLGNEACIWTGTIQIMIPFERIVSRAD